MSHNPLEIEIVAHVISSMQHCTHCQAFIDGTGIGGQVHQENLEAYPEEFVREWRLTSQIVLELAERFPEQVNFRITDAQSLRGLWKALSKGIRRYPTFIIEGGETYHGWDSSQIGLMIQRHLEMAEG